MNNDICRCIASNCPIAETCARFVVPGGEWTGYADLSKPREECGFFIAIEVSDE